MRNNSARALSDCVLLDTMPANSDDSTFSGSYKVSKWSIDTGSVSNLSDLSLYYTTDAAVSGKTSSDFTASGIRSGWTKADISAAGQADLSAAGQITGWALVGTIKSGETVDISLAILPEGNSGGDRYINKISSGEAYGSASVVIADRVVSGIVWRDDNKDGIRDETEKGIPGVKLELRKTSPATRGLRLLAARQADGSYTCTTDSNGEYSFDSLPAGVYELTALSGTEDISNYTVSPVADDNKATGTFDGDGKLQKATISAVDLPSLASMDTAVFKASDNDIGLIPTVVKVEYRWVGEDIPDGAALPEAETIPIGSEYTAKKATVPDDYEFSGWFTDKACKTKYVDKTQLNEDTVLYGKLSKKPVPDDEEIRVEYKWVGKNIPNEATLPDTEIIPKGTEYTAGKAKVPDGYKFKGWYTDEACKHKYKDGTELTEDTILYGKCEQSSGGSKTGDDIVPYAIALNLLLIFAYIAVLTRPKLSLKEAAIEGDMTLWMKNRKIVLAYWSKCRIAASSFISKFRK